MEVLHLCSRLQGCCPDILFFADNIFPRSGSRERPHNVVCAKYTDATVSLTFTQQPRVLPIHERMWVLGRLVCGGRRVGAGNACAVSSSIYPELHEASRVSFISCLNRPGESLLDAESVLDRRASHRSGSQQCGY